MAQGARTEDSVYFTFHGGRTCWGAHICALYESDEQRDDLVLSFFAEGARTGDDLAYAADESTWMDLPDRFKEIMGYEYDLFRIKEHELACFNGEQPSWLIPEPCGQGELFAASGGLRSAVDMGWLLRERPSSSSCCQAEARLDACVAERRWIALCLYDVRRFSSAELMLALKTHPYVYRGGVIPNQFYQGKAIVKAKFSAPARVAEATGQSSSSRKADATDIA